MANLNSSTITRPRRLIRRVAIVAASLLAGLALLLTIVFVALDSDAIAARARDLLVPRLSASLNREVSIDDLQARILPNPHVRLGRLVVHGSGDEPPLIEAQSLDVDLALWPLIRSFGKDVRITSIALVRPEMNALRGRDGNWNFEDLGTDDEDNDAPPSERTVRIDRIEVSDGRIRIIDRSGPHGESTVALEDVDLTVDNLAPGEPMQVKGAAAFASARQNLDVDLHLGALPTSMEELGPGKWPEVRGELKLRGAEIPRLEGLLPAKFAAIVRGGVLQLEAGVTTVDGIYVVEGDVRLDAVRLRGEPANGGFHLAARIDPAEPNAARTQLDRIVLKGPGVDLGGSASLVASPVQVQFALSGPLLDLQSILGVMPEKEPEETGARTAVLPAQLRRTIEGVAVRGSLDVERIVSGKLEATGFSARATLERGVLALQKAQANLYDGSVDASGTTVNLLAPLPKWHLKARLSDVDTMKAMTALGGAAPLQGRIAAALDLTGAGAAWEQVRTSMSGSGVMALAEGVLTSTDLGGAVARGAAEGLRRLGKTKAADVAQRAAGQTDLRDLTASFTVRDGWLHLREPLTFSSNSGAGRLEGRVGLDKQLKLAGTVIASKEFLASALGGIGVTPPGPVEVPLQIGGTLLSPQLDVNEAAIARSIAQGGLRQGAKKVEDEVKRQARRRMGGLLERIGGGGRQ